MPFDGQGARVQPEDVVKDDEDMGEVLADVGQGISDESAAAIEMSTVGGGEGIDIGVDEPSPALDEYVDHTALAAFQLESTLRTKKLGIYEPPNILNINTRGTSANLSNTLDSSRYAPTIRFTKGAGAEPVGYPINQNRFGRLTKMESEKFIDPGFV
jgi:hypothetical protein